MALEIFINILAEEIEKRVYLKVAVVLIDDREVYCIFINQGDFKLVIKPIGFAIIYVFGVNVAKNYSELMVV